MSLYNDLHIIDAQLRVFRSSVAMAIAARKRTDQQYNLATIEVKKWQDRVQQALQKGNESLVNLAWEQEKLAIATANMLKNQLDEQTAHVEDLKCRLRAWDSKISQTKVQSRVEQLSTSSAIEAFEQVEKRILMRIEALDRIEEQVLILETQAKLESKVITDEMHSNGRAISTSSEIEAFEQIEEKVCFGARSMS